MSVEIESRPVEAPNGKVHLQDEVQDFTALAEPVAPVKRRRINVRRLILPIGAVILVVGLVFGVNMYREGQMYVSTENAQLTGTPVQVAIAVHPSTQWCFTV